MPKSKATTANGAQTRLPQTWIFQANPDKYRIETSLKREDGEMWGLRQNAKRIAVNDRVLLWISGSEAGIYAVGRVMTAPVLMSDTPTGMGYWNDKAEGKRPYSRVWVKYDRVMFDRPLLRALLKWDPELWNMSILRNARATNFRVTEAEAAAIDVWLDEP